jgi:hypothetical protein
MVISELKPCLETFEWVTLLLSERERKEGACLPVCHCVCYWLLSLLLQACGVRARAFVAVIFEAHAFEAYVFFPPSNLAALQRIHACMQGLCVR